MSHYQEAFLSKADSTLGRQVVPNQCGYHVLTLNESTGGTAGPSTSVGMTVTVSANHFTQLLQAIESLPCRMDDKLLRFQEEVQQG